MPTQQHLPYLIQPLPGKNEALSNLRRLQSFFIPFPFFPFKDIVLDVPQYKVVWTVINTGIYVE